MAKSLKIPKIQPEKIYNQSFKDFVSDPDRRTPEEKQSTVAFYYWIPDNSNITPKEMKKQFEIYAQLFKQYYPKLKTQLMGPLGNDYIGKGKDAISIFHKQTIYFGKKLLESFEKSIIPISPKIYANILITPIVISNRPGLTVEGLAKRENGLAVISTLNASPLTVIHEMGHLLGIRHCPLACLMIAGKIGVKSVKKEGENISNFCEQCLMKVNKSLINIPNK